VVFLLAMGILVVLIILLFTQSRTQDSTGKEISASALGARGRVAVESCIAELAFRLIEKGAGEDASDAVHEGMRAFVPGAAPPDRRPGIMSDDPLYLDTFELDASVTAEAYQDQGDVEFGESRVGPSQRTGFPGEEELQTRDHRGVVTLEQEAVVTPPWGGFSMKVVGRFQRAYRAVTVAVPPPFSAYTALVKEIPGDANRFRTYYDNFQAASQRFLADGGDEEDLPEFPVRGMEGSVGGYFVTTVAALPASAWNVDALGTAPGTMGVSEMDDIRDAFALLEAGSWERLTGDEVEELEAHMRLLSGDGLGPRSSFRMANMADLAGYLGTDEGALDLQGVVHVKTPVTLDHEASGPAVLWTDAAQGVTIRRLEVSNPEGIVVVSTVGDIRLEVPAGTIIRASLLAPRGTVRGLDGVTVNGHLLMGRYPPDMEQGVAQQRPAASVPAPAPGRPLEEAGRRSQQVVFDAGFLRKDFRRHRLRGLLGGG